MQTIAIIGMGAMGSRMARRLLDAGYPVQITSRQRDRARGLEAAGATWASTPREAARGADVVLAMVTDDEASRAIWLDPSTGAVASLDSATVAIESSTLTPGWVRTLAGQVEAQGAAFVEAPVVGTRPHAEAGQLTHLVAGNDKSVEASRAVLEQLGARIQRTGAIGSAMTIKLAINALLAAQVTAWAEVLGTLRRAGIEPATAAELLGSTPVASPALKGLAGTMVSRRFEPMFPIDLVYKDLGYFIEVGTATGAELPTTSAARGAYGKARKAGHGGNNIAGVARVIG